jgi:hypothetical protein
MLSVEMFRAAVGINRNKSSEYETWPSVLSIIQTKQAFTIDLEYFITCTVHEPARRQHFSTCTVHGPARRQHFSTCTVHGPARRQHQHTYCVYTATTRTEFMRIITTK